MVAFFHVVIKDIQKVFCGLDEYIKSLQEHTTPLRNMTLEANLLGTFLLPLTTQVDDKISTLVTWGGMSGT